MAELGRKFKPSTVLFYLKVLSRYTEFLFSTEEITNRWYTRVHNSLKNFRATFEKWRRQTVEMQDQHEAERLPARVRHTYFSSRYVEVRRSLLSNRADVANFIPFRDFLIVAITFYNGHRPGALQNLTVGQVRAATIQVVDGEEPAADRTYFSILLAQHKTDKTDWP